jgi:TatA/E family protein of Tat protein translocase
MGIENPVHIIFIGIIALLVLGPKRLPEVARALGHGLREFREAVSQQGEAPQQASAQQAPVLPPVSQLPAAQLSGEAVLPQQSHDLAVEQPTVQQVPQPQELPAEQPPAPEAASDHVEQQAAPPAG